ncbi:MAG: hypothetical protein SVZ03_06760 [Spirochaetota bacterium]|nr:hypothetical protein [Spirochaetota bacterium]
MKKLNLLSFMLIFLFYHNLFADEPYNSKFAQKDVLEISGGISVLSHIDDDSKVHRVSFSPAIDYYLIDNIHFGISPASYFTYNDYDKFENSKTIGFRPNLIAGYTFKIDNNLFFDISPSIGYGYLKVFNSDDDTHKSISYGLDISLKYDLDGALINLRLGQLYTDYIDNSSLDDYYDISIGLGYSLYFDIN